MRFSAKALLAERFDELLAKRQKLPTAPVIALVWVGDDPLTAIFVRAKQAMAKKLECQFFLHHFPSSSNRQLDAVLEGLNGRRDVDGIVLQLPLPKSIDGEKLIEKISPAKDIDNLRGDSPYQSPTPSGIIALLSYDNIVIKGLKTVILGAGKLVGQPLATEFRRQGWPFDQIERDAASQATNICNHDLLISATGVKDLVTPAMVHSEMIVVDGSGVDVDVAKIEPLVKLVTPPKGAIGPLTVSYLFENLLLAAGK